METLTAAQSRLIAARNDQVKMCIELDDTTPIRYCTGADAVQVGGDWYDPYKGEIWFDKIALASPAKAKTKITFDDLDRAIRTQWYTTKIDCDATIYWLLREADGSWVTVLTVSWSVENCSYNAKGFTVNLSAAVGSRPRAGGAIGTKSAFPYAPDPGTTLRVGSFGGVTFRPGIGVPPPPPGGQQVAYKPNDPTAPISDGPGSTPSSPGSSTGGSLPSSTLTS